MHAPVRGATHPLKGSRLPWRLLHRHWWLVLLIMLPVAAGVELLSLSADQNRYDDVSIQLETLRADVNRAAANVGWDLALRAPAPGVESELRSLQSTIATGLVSLQTNPVDPSSVRAITASTAALMDSLMTAVSSPPTPALELSLVRQHTRLVALVDAYSGRLADASAQADTMFRVSVWVVLLVESALIGGALWYGLSQRRRAAVEAARQQPLQRLAAVLDNAPVIAWAISVDGVLTFLEGSALDRVGIRREDLLGHSMLDIFGDREDVLSARRRILNGEEINVQLDVLDRTWDVHGSLVAPGGGAAPEIIGVAQDVTELVRSREELRAANRETAATLTLLETLQSSAPVGFAFVDRDFRFVRINDSLAAINGVPPSAHIGRTVQDVVSAAIWAALEPAYRHVIESGEAVINLELSWDHAADPGRRHHSLNSYYPVRDGVDVVGIGIVLVDITEHVEAEARIVASQQALQASEERFRELVQQSSDMTSIFSADGQRTYVSPAVQEFYGVSAEQAPPDWLEHVYEEDRERVETILHHVRDHAEATATMRFRLYRPDGTLREVESHVRNALDRPAVSGIVINTRDVTDTARAQALLGTQARIMTMIASGATLHDTLIAIAAEVEERLPDARCAIQLLGVDGSLEVAGAVGVEDLACARMRGLPVDRQTICGSVLLRDTPMLVMDPAASARFGGAPCFHEDGRVEECWVSPIRRDPSGAPVGVLSCYFAHPYEPDEDARQMVSTACELAAVAIDRKRFEDQLSHQALHDQLTGLPNRALLLEQLRSDVARSSRTASIGAVLFIDLDRFKVVNDSLGHEAGDHVLREMSKRIAAEVRAEDTVARLGGDEFVVSCSDIGDDEESIRLAQRLLRAIAQPFTVRAQEIRLTASIGIAIRHPSSANVDALMRNADVALYRAKERGRDRWEMFDRSLRNRAVKRLRTETALRKAVDAGAFELWYQPVWSVAQQQVRSVEALLRWPQPGGRMASPASFIPVAEETGLISTLGAWVLGRACADGALLEREGTVVPHIAVNAAARQLIDGSLVPAVEAALAAHGWDPRRLTVEVTESAIVVDSPVVMETLKALRALHVSVALDDFGTGFSSMSYIKQFGYIDVIKIDRSFVADLGDRGSADHAIVRATIALAEAVGATVVAEGVETAEQLDALMTLGCDRIQGYLVARPMPLRDLRSALVQEPWRAALQPAHLTPPGLRVVAGI